MDRKHKAIMLAALVLVLFSVIATALRPQPEADRPYVPEWQWTCWRVYYMTWQRYYVGDGEFVWRPVRRWRYQCGWRYR